MKFGQRRVCQLFCSGLTHRMFRSKGPRSAPLCWWWVALAVFRPSAAPQRKFLDLGSSCQRTFPELSQNFQRAFFEHRERGKNVLSVGESQAHGADFVPARGRNYVQERLRGAYVIIKGPLRRAPKCEGAGTSRKFSNAYTGLVWHHGALVYFEANSASGVPPWVATSAAFSRRWQRRGLGLRRRKLEQFFSEIENFNLIKIS